MSPKPVQHLIELAGCGLGFAERFQWEKEILVDYLAQRIWEMAEVIEDEAELHYKDVRHSYSELCKIARALRDRPNTGLHAKIHLRDAFGDLRDYVAWDKEELADTMIFQIVGLDLFTVLKSSVSARQAEEVNSIAFAMLMHKGLEVAEMAEKDAESFRRYRADQEALRKQRLDARPAARAESATADTPLPSPSPKFSANGGKKAKAA